MCVLCDKNCSFVDELRKAIWKKSFELCQNWGRGYKNFGLRLNFCSSYLNFVKALSFFFRLLFSIRQQRNYYSFDSYRSPLVFKSVSKCIANLNNNHMLSIYTSNENILQICTKKKKFSEGIQILATFIEYS